MRYLLTLAGFILALGTFVSSSHASSFSDTVPMVRKGAATFYVHGDIGGYGNVEMMVDTGAGYTTINQATLAVLQKNGNAEYVKELTGILADGSRLTVPVYRIKTLTLGNSCTLHNVEAAVFPKRTRMLLGLTALEKAAPFVFSTNPPSLLLSNCTAS